MNYLGFDYGQKHIGVAIATGPLAEPLTTIPTKSALQLIKELIKKHDIKTLIIGQPDNSLKLGFENLINSLRLENWDLVIVDETLSSHDARQSLLHTSQSRRRVGEHSASAAIILQSWLDSH